MIGGPVAIGRGGEGIVSSPTSSPPGVANKDDGKVMKNFTLGS